MADGDTEHDLERDSSDVSSDVPSDDFVPLLRVQLQQSRQQQTRLRDSLTRVLSLIDEAERPG